MQLLLEQNYAKLKGNFEYLKKIVRFNSHSRIILMMLTKCRIEYNSIIVRFFLLIHNPQLCSDFVQKLAFDVFYLYQYLLCVCV